VPRAWAWAGASIATLAVVAAIVMATREPAYVTPGPAEAREIFSPLLRDAYYAFDNDSEVGVRAALAEVAAASLVEEFHDQLRRGLIDTERGGAMSQVSSVFVTEADLTDTTPADLPGEGGFRIASTWLITGHVRHQGHVHPRLVEFRGVHAVALRDGQWKIAEATILSENVSGPDDDQELTIGPRTP